MEEEDEVMLPQRHLWLLNNLLLCFPPHLVKLLSHGKCLLVPKASVCVLYCLPFSQMGAKLINIFSVKVDIGI